ncbi:MAG: MarR family transcriptional regulator [Thermomicrobiales bacterium]|nr:MarR family transcriptional regulator [Thermomicrobiales bacterium]
MHDHLGFWLRRLSDKVHVSFERKLAAFDVTVSQWNVLVTLYRGEGTTVGEIARYLQIDVAAVSRLVDRLASKELVARSADPASRRRVSIVLTNAGLALAPRLLIEADRNDASFFGELSPEEHAYLMSLLQRLDQQADNLLLERGTTE